MKDKTKTGLAKVPAPDAEKGAALLPAALLTTEQFTTQALEQYETDEQKIERYKQRAAGLTIDGIDDKAGFKAVDALRLSVKTARTGVERTRKELKAVALKYGAAVDNRAKVLTDALTPIEEGLIDKLVAIKNEQFRIDNEKEKARLEALAIQQAAEEAERKRVADEVAAELEKERIALEAEKLQQQKDAAAEKEYQARVTVLVKLGFVYDTESESYLIEPVDAHNYKVFEIEMRQMDTHDWLKIEQEAQAYAKSRKPDPEAEKAQRYKDTFGEAEYKERAVILRRLGFVESKADDNTDLFTLTTPGGETRVLSEAEIRDYDDMSFAAARKSLSGFVIEHTHGSPVVQPEAAAPVSNFTPAGTVPGYVAEAFDSDITSDSAPVKHEQFVQTGETADGTITGEWQEIIRPDSRQQAAITREIMGKAAEAVLATESTGQSIEIRVLTGGDVPTLEMWYGPVSGWAPLSEEHLTAIWAALTVLQGAGTGQETMPVGDAVKFAQLAMRKGFNTAKKLINGHIAAVLAEDRWTGEGEDMAETVTAFVKAVQLPATDGGE